MLHFTFELAVAKTGDLLGKAYSNWFSGIACTLSAPVTIPAMLIGSATESANNFGVGILPNELANFLQKCNPDLKVNWSRTDDFETMKDWIRWEIDAGRSSVLLLPNFNTDSAMNMHYIATAGYDSERLHYVNTTRKMEKMDWDNLQEAMDAQWGDGITFSLIRKQMEEPNGSFREISVQGFSGTMIPNMEAKRYHMVWMKKK